MFSAANMKICGRQNVRKHREIKGIDKYVTLEISLKSDSPHKRKSHIYSKKIIREDQERGLLPLWVSSPN